VAAVSDTASEARGNLYPLIKRVNEDHDALREGSYLLRTPANARRLLNAYENALSRTNLSERTLIDPDAADADKGR
jgi:antitoxin YefM